MKFSNHESDLQILPENETETQKLVDFCEANKLRLITCFSNVKGQDWYGKRYYEIPFCVSMKPEIEKYCTTYK